jgi:ribosomal protein L11 methyltransferase
MVEISVIITPELMDELEALFCEELQQNWLLFQKDRMSPPYLKGYFDDESQATEALKALCLEVGGIRADDSEIQPVEDQDWKMAYRHHLKPWKYGRLNWVPEWERETFPMEADNVYLYLDSGMAFGTGSHETTRLCTEALYDYLDKKESYGHEPSVIDAGCGSGILAMSAVLLGIGKVYAFDRDPQAVKVTFENLEKNGLSEVIEVSEAGLEEGLRDRRGDIILANIQADVLMIYADNIIHAWDPDGILILSGILATEREKTTSAFQEKMDEIYTDHSFDYRWAQKGDWVSVMIEQRD